MSVMIDPFTSVECDRPVYFGGVLIASVVLSVDNVIGSELICGWLRIAASTHFFSFDLCE
jgi:hypothetical protein